MEIYRNKKGSFREIKKRSLRITLPLMLLALLFGVGISYNSVSGLDTLPFVLIISLAAASFGIYRGMNRQRTLFDSYSLTVEDDFLTREQLHTPTVRMARHDIQEIISHTNGSLLIKGKNPADVIMVSEMVADRDRLMATLSGISQIKHQETKSIQQRFILPLIVVGLVLLAMVYISKNIYLVLSSGTVLVLGLLWSIYQVQASKNVDRKTKRSIWWSVLVILSVLGTMYAKLNG
ncbi:hypothetical protein ACMA1I_16190 [Pontibacter sp. 13R65]|uniref:hypothetical protein n=1 Tax=Pontibacter sp. 13R65 TaxID=3127458 RepID=UPI00301C97F7